MSTRIAAIILTLVAACDNNITRPPDARVGVPPTGPVTDPPVDPGDCQDVDDLGVCPRPPTQVDASEPEPDSQDVMDLELKAACCHALVDGTPPKFECGYPPGLCRNGKKTLQCGDGAFYELCNP